MLNYIVDFYCHELNIGNWNG
ncbi:hypothetical protein ACXYMU_03120 [Pontibacter sp. CAU 1760]